MSGCFSDDYKVAEKYDKLDEKDGKVEGKNDKVGEKDVKADDEKIDKMEEK